MTVPDVRYRTMNRIIFVLSIIGVGIAIYVFQSFVRQAPIVCLNSGCELVRKHPAAYLLGFPVPGFGLVGYSILAILAFLRTTSEHLFHKLALPIRLIAGGGVLFVAWFTYTELLVIRAICTWCAVSAVNMLVIFLLSLNSSVKTKGASHESHG